MEKIKYNERFLIRFILMILLLLIYHGIIFGRYVDKEIYRNNGKSFYPGMERKSAANPNTMDSENGFDKKDKLISSLFEFKNLPTTVDSVKHTKKSAAKKQKQKTTKKKKPASKTITLPSSKLNICKYGFAYVGFKDIQVEKLKVKVSGKSVKKAKVVSSGKQILLVAGKDYGVSIVTVTGKIVDSTGTNSFTQKITVTVVECKKPKPNKNGKGNHPDSTAGGPNIIKNICEGDSYYYTLNITAPNGSNTLINVNAQSNNTDVAGAKYDKPSQTVSGMGNKQGQAIITVTGEVEDDANDENIPFSLTITVNVMKCVSIEVCKGKTFLVQMDNASNAASSNQGIATAAIAPKGINVTGVDIGSATIDVTNSDNNPSGKITVTVKKCPPPNKIDSSETVPYEKEPKYSGFYLGGELIKNWGSVRTTETWSSTGEVTNQFDDSGDPFGAGIVAGDNFLHWDENIIAGPFVSFDLMNQTINTTFGGGTYIGTTTHWIAAAGIKGGIVTTSDIYLYGMGSIALLNQDLNINFGGPITSNNTTALGFTFGIGGEYQPSFLQNLGRPVSLSLQYQHAWWLSSDLNNPAASPGFNYNFSRADNTIKLGVNFYLWQVKQ